MGSRLSGRCLWVPLIAVVLYCLQSVSGFRFAIDREECFSRDVKYQGDTVQLPSSCSGEGTYRGADSRPLQKFNFVARHKGVHRFCFTNKSPYHESLDFDVHVGHFAYHFEHAKDGLAEHFNPLLQQIEKLKDALSKIQFEQHWLNAQTHLQAGVNKVMSARSVKKAVFESGALIGASALQVYLLHCLFDQRVDKSWV